MQKSRFLSVLVLSVLIGVVFGDIYLHNPRGSNNRYRGDQNNNNRLFDSQNNNNGGYGWGPSMTFYEGSLLQIEWTSQHGCGTGHNNVECEIILQYMCAPHIRDGTEDSIVPENVESLSENDQQKYGYHETGGYYSDCKNRRRNNGLFIADQNINVNSPATQTRQDNNRRGLECPEERDYYPYWHPSPWKDIAILTSGPTAKRCGFYRSNSQNVASKGHCVVADAPDLNINVKDPRTYNRIWGFGAPQNNPEACRSAKNKWVVVPSWGLPEPECLGHGLQRDNHLGNTDFGTMTARYLWVLPTPAWDNPNADAPLRQATCVFRLRYNITTEDFKGWQHIDDGATMIDYRWNGESSPVKNNPEINFGRDDLGHLRNLSIALNTAQTGRTFQDRSHTFIIKPRPFNVPPTTRIFNLNVRGKRGNIVQAYPSVEYDFSPNNLKVTKDDLVHFQWTGSDTNPQGNAGEGTARTDRNNIVQVADNGGNARRNLPMPISQQTMFDRDVAYKLAHLNQPDVCVTETQTACCKTYEQLRSSNNNNQNAIEQDVQNCGKLNSASAYFNGGLIPMKSSGTFHYMSTRNNNFSNRSQKATIEVSDRLPAVALTAVVIGSAGFVVAAVVAGGVWYAKTHTASAAANIFNGVKI